MSKNENTNRSRIIRLLLLAGVVILLVWAAMKVWRTYQVTTSLLARQNQAERLLEDGLANVNADAAEELVYGLRSDVVSLENEIGFLPFWTSPIDFLSTSCPPPVPGPVLIAL